MMSFSPDKPKNFRLTGGLTVNLLAQICKIFRFRASSLTLKGLAGISTRKFF